MRLALKSLCTRLTVFVFVQRDSSLIARLIVSRHIAMNALQVHWFTIVHHAMQRWRPERMHFPALEVEHIPATLMIASPFISTGASQHLQAMAHIPTPLSSQSYQRGSILLLRGHAERTSAVPVSQRISDAHMTQCLQLSSSVHVLVPPLPCRSPLKTAASSLLALGRVHSTVIVITDSTGNERRSAPKGHDIHAGLHWRQAAWQRPSIVGADIGNGPFNDPARGADVLMLQKPSECQASHS